MENQIFTNALFWEKQGEMPYFKKIELKYKESDLLIKVEAAMFGKTLYRALMIGHPNILPPRVLGTLLAGKVINSSGEIKKGSRVVINPHAINKNGEKLCLVPGGISEKVIIQNGTPNGIFVIPDNVSFEEAVYTELISCGIGSLEKAYGAEELVIVGCGVMALIQIQLAKKRGFSKIVCIYNHPCKKKIIEKNGAIAVKYIEDYALLKKNISDILSGKRVAIIDSVGSNVSAELTFELAWEKSKIVLFAGYPIGSEVTINLNKIHYSNISILGSYHFENQVFEIALKMLEDKVIDVKQLITGQINWKNIEQIYKKFRDENNISNIVMFD